MTFARWRNDFDVEVVVSEIWETITPVGGDVGGLLRFSGSAIYREPITLLETGVKFEVPISETDRQEIIGRALSAALKSEDYGSSALIKEINKAARDFWNTPETKYVVVTRLSIRHFEDITRVWSSGSRMYVRRQLPPPFVETREEAKRESERTDRIPFPEDESLDEYAAVWIYVLGRTLSDAIHRAGEALDLQRGIWNFDINRGIGMRLPAPIRGPTNQVLAGPIYSLHLPDGALAANHVWGDPQYVEPQDSTRLGREWDVVYRNEQAIRGSLKRSPYRGTLEDALRRYCRALDSVELSTAFLKLWSVLETLTFLQHDEGQDTLVKRVSFIFPDQHRKTEEQVLQHLRRYRNTYVHAGLDSNQAGAYLDQLRYYTQRMLEFHLRNSRYFSSWEEVARLLDLPPNVPQLERMIEEQERNAKKAVEAVRRAREGIRFRESG